MTQLLLDTARPEPYASPELDTDQQVVVGHRRGGLRVLAGPGTGKTTTLVAAMSQRLSGPDALRADQVLGLTFGRRAALNWRDQVSRAIGGGAVPMVSTFHSFCYGLLRTFAPHNDLPVSLSLLSGPEQQVRTRTLFGQAVAEGRVAWPADLADAVGTRGLTEEIRAVMARTRTHAMEPQDLAALASAPGGNPLWSSVASFMDEYLNVMDAAGVIDYSELIYRALLLVQGDDEVRRYLHSTFKAVYVDEYQDTDPGQILLLKAMMTADSSLVVVGDFDQAIYGFRGADETAILDFHDEFGPVFGGATSDVVLATCRRFGPRLRRVAELVIDPYQPIPARVPADVLARHRGVSCTPTEPGRIDVLTFDSEGAQAAHIADLIAREHAVSGRPWSDMAVIVRSAVASLPAVYRALVSAGVPTEVAGDEIPIHQDAAVAPLLDLMRAVEDESTLTPEVAIRLLTGPLGGVDPVDLRRYSRFLRDQARAQSPGEVPDSSSWLIATALRDPMSLAPAPAHREVVGAVTRVGGVIADARRQMRQGATPHEVLWLLWDGCPWGATLRRQALDGGFASGRAHRDLDAVCALFDHAARFSARRGKGLGVFLDELLAQQIPAETLAENDLRGDAVRVLTAHRAKGLEWPFVVVAAVQEDLWPNRVVPATVLTPERIGRHEIVAPQTAREVLDSERRLFYVATTRAKAHLVVTAVATAGGDDGVCPSSFFTALEASAGDLGADAVVLRTGRPTSPLSAEGVIATLRRALATADSPALRDAAATRLDMLARDGGPAFAAADPGQWWGARERTAATEAADSPVELSGSGIEAIETCPAKWFLERRVHAQLASESHLTFGNVLHKIAEGIARGSVAADIGALEAALDRLWPGMAYDVEWESRRQLAAARAASLRLLRWFADHSEVTVGAECAVSATVTVPHPDDPTQTIDVSLRGRADRIELSADGAAVFDFKTGRKVGTVTEVVRSIQLALYEYMLTHGTFVLDGVAQPLPDGVAVTHTALVHLRHSASDDDELPIEQRVASGSHDAKQPTNTVLDRVARAAAVIQGGRYETRYDTEDCKRCPVRFLCPASPDGRGVL